MGARLPAPRRIGVLRALQIGDLLCAVPALRALRHACPQAAITLIGLPWGQGFVRRFAHLLDAFVEFPGYPGLPERSVDAAAFDGFVAAARLARLDLVLQMHGSGRITNRIVARLGAARTAGFHPADEPCPNPATFTPWPEQGSEVERCLALTDFLGMPRQGNEREFPLFASEHAQAEALCATHRLGEFVCVHPGARLPSRRWPIERFAAVAQALAGAGFRVVVTGTHDEARLCATVAAAAGRHAVDLCDRTSLGVTAALIARARALVCNDTGVSHIAAALRTPTVVVSCGADPERFAPEDRLRHRVLAAMTPCRPCMHEECPFAHECATAVGVDDVLAALGQVLALPLYEAPAALEA